MGNPTTYTWHPLTDHQEEAVHQTLFSWVRTPYRDGHRIPGIGADCVQLAAGVLDDLCRRKVPSQIPQLASGISPHDPRTAFQTILALRKLFPSVVVRDFSLEPGDLVVMRSIPDPNGPRRPGHVMIVGTVPWSCLHATRSGGVCWTSIEEASSGILRIYRSLEKEKWGINGH